MRLGVCNGHQIISQKIVLESIDDKPYLGSQVEDNRLQPQQDIYILQMIENIEMNSKNKLSNLICHYNYQTWHFSTFCALSIAPLINELRIATNLRI